MSVPVPRTWGAGEPWVYGNMNAEIRDAINFLLNPDRVKVHGSADWLSIAAAATWYSITFNTEDWDTNATGMHTGSSSQLVCRTAGKFEFKGQVRVNAPGSAWGASGRIFVQALKNGSTVMDTVSVNPMDANLTSPTAVIGFEDQLIVGDYMELQVHVASPPTTPINPGLVSGVDNTWFSAKWSGI